MDSDETVEAFWSTGKVGMTGTSYNGTLPLAAATTGVQGLEAIIPIAPNTSYYHYYRSNGLVRHPGGYMGEDIDVLYNFIHSGNEKHYNDCNANVRDSEMANGQDRVTGDYNEFWAGRDYLNDMGPMKAALLMAHGFNDWNVVPEHSVRIYEAAKKKGLPVQFYCHQGGHGGPPPLKLMNRWFTKYLHGIDNDVEKDPKSWIVREKADRENPTSYPDYPHPESVAVPLYPQAGGASSGMLSLSKIAKATTEKLVDDYKKKGSDLASATTSEHRLLYATPELKEPLHLSGYAKVKIRVACNKPACNLSVWLVSLPWTNDSRTRTTDNLITRGWADPQNHRSLTKSEPLVPNQFYDVAFDLQPDDQIVPAGEKIGLMIFSTDPEFTLQPDAGTELQLTYRRPRSNFRSLVARHHWKKPGSADDPFEPLSEDRVQRFEFPSDDALTFDSAGFRWMDRAPEMAREADACRVELMERSRMARMSVAPEPDRLRWWRPKRSPNHVDSLLRNARPPSRS